MATPNSSLHGSGAPFPGPPVNPLPMIAITNMIGTLEPFHGTPSEDASEWLDRFVDVAFVNNWEEGVWLIQFSSCMVGLAKSWWNSLSREIKTDWERVREAFEEEFMGQHQSFDYYRLINGRIQGRNESALGYCWDMRKLLDRANPDMSERDRLHFLIRGLHPELRKQLIRKGPENWEDAVAIIKKEENHLRQIQAFDQGVEIHD